MPKPTAHDVTIAHAGLTTKILLVGVGMLTLGHLIAAAAPGIRTWGIDYWSELPAGVRWLMVGMVGLALFPPLARAVDAMIGRVRWRPAGVLATAVILAILFVVFRSRALAYGDGYSFSGYLAAGTMPRFEAQLAVMWLDLTVHWALYRFLVMPLGGSVDLTYAILSALGGLFALWAVVRIATVVTTSGPARRLLIAAALASGAVALWFGYVEAYTLTNAAGLWALVFAIDAQRRPRLLWGAWGLWVVACAFHLLAVPLALPLAWATWRVRRPATPPLSHQAAAVRFGAGFLVCAIGGTILHQIGRAITVPVWRTPDSTYTALSIHHLADVFNQALLVAPVGLIGLVVWLVGRHVAPGGSATPTTTRGAARGILAVAAASTWYFAFWVDPLLGAFRDWDLLAGFGIPLSLWGALVLWEPSGKGTHHAWRWVPVALLAAIHVGSYVVALQDETRGAMRVDRLVRQDSHYSAGFFRGARLTPWAFTMAKEEGRWDIAAEHFRRRAESCPTDAMSWKNLGAACQRLGTYDSSIAAYEQAAHCDSNDVSTYQCLGLLYIRRDDPERAVQTLTRAVALSDTTLVVRNLLAQSYQRLGMLERADSVTQETIRLRPDDYEAYYLLARGAQVRGDTATALRYYEDAVARNPADEEVYIRLVELCQKGKDRERTATAARRWEAKFPADPKSSFILGTTYLLLGQFDSANAAFQRTLKHAPGDAVAMYYLATTFRHQGHPEKSRELAERAAKLDTSLALPWLELIYLAEDAGDRAAAAGATREYLRRSPADSGRAYFRQFLDR
jgi:tetratricopeptide (TPR) repeat protein